MFIKLYLHKPAASRPGLACGLQFTHLWCKITELQRAGKGFLQPSRSQETQHYNKCWRAAWKLEKTVASFSEIPETSVVKKVTSRDNSWALRGFEVPLAHSVAGPGKSPEQLQPSAKERRGRVNPNLLCSPPTLPEWSLKMKLIYF